jgi:hypothetical protein
VGGNEEVSLFQYGSENLAVGAATCWDVFSIVWYLLIELDGLEGECCA